MGEKESLQTNSLGARRNSPSMEIRIKELFLDVVLFFRKALKKKLCIYIFSTLLPCLTVSLFIFKNTVIFKNWV